MAICLISAVLWPGTFAVLADAIDGNLFFRAFGQNLDNLSTQGTDN